MIPMFEYNGVPVTKLESIHKIKDIDARMEETANRLEALFSWCQERDIVISSAHLAGCLRVSENSFNAMTSGKVRQGDRYVAPEVAGYSAEDAEKVRLFSQYLNEWQTLCKMQALNKLSNDSIPARSIYLAKALYHMWDTPQDKADAQKTGMELVIVFDKARSARERGKK